MYFKNSLGKRFQNHVQDHDKFQTGEISSEFVEEVFGKDTLELEYSEGYNEAYKNAMRYIFDKTVELVDFINSNEKDNIPENKYIKKYFDIKKPETCDTHSEEYIGYLNQVFGFMTIITECILPKKKFTDNQEIYSQAKDIWQAELMREYLAHLM